VLVFQEKIKFFKIFLSIPIKNIARRAAEGRIERNSHRISSVKAKIVAFQEVLAKITTAIQATKTRRKSHRIIKDIALSAFSTFSRTHIMPSSHQHPHLHHFHPRHCTGLVSFFN
jgi:hypothetical protein